MQNVVISKNWPAEGLCGRCLSVWGPEPHTPPYTLSTCIAVHIILFHTGKGGGRVEPERRGERQRGRVQITKLGWQYQHDWMYARNWLYPVYKLPLQVNFLEVDIFTLTSMSLLFILVHSSNCKPQEINVKYTIWLGRLRMLGTSLEM